MRFWIVLLLVISLTACASGRSEGWYSLVDWTGLVDWEKTERSNQWAIDDDALLYVAMPTQELLKDSFHAKLTTTFQRYYPKTRAAIHRESLRQSFVSAQYAGMDYLIYPHIRNIEDPVKSRFPDEWKKIFEKKTYDIRRGHLDMDILIFVISDENLVDRLTLETSPRILAQDDSELMFEKLDDFLRDLSR